MNDFSTIKFFRGMCLLTSISIFLGCRRDSVSQTEIFEACKRDRSECSTDCQEKDFHFCYLDPAITSGHVDLRKHCYGMHAGRNCKPCKNEYVLNFGGAMRAVSCKYFYRSLAKKNQQCNNCLDRIENVSMAE